MTHRALANLAAYELWAATYPPVPHNPLMRAEQNAMELLWPDASESKSARVLDLGCGSGRYAALASQKGASSVVALDYSSAMLRRLEGGLRVRADMMRLPLPDAMFDMVVSGLAVGHAPRLNDWLCECARVLVPGGVLLYSDFHPAAGAAGMTRSFTDSDNRRHTLAHRRYEIEEHQLASKTAGLEIQATREVRVGFELTEGFAGAEAFYRRWHGIPVVWVARARKHSNA